MCAPVREDLRPMFPFLLRVNRTDGRSSGGGSIVSSQERAARHSALLPLSLSRSLALSLSHSPGAPIKRFVPVLSGSFSCALLRVTARYPPPGTTKTSAGFIGINRIVTSEAVQSREGGFTFAPRSYARAVRAPACVQTGRSSASLSLGGDPPDVVGRLQRNVGRRVYLRSVSPFSPSLGLVGEILGSRPERGPSEIGPRSS